MERLRGVADYVPRRHLGAQWLVSGDPASGDLRHARLPRVLPQRGSKRANALRLQRSRLWVFDTSFGC